ncbi:MAG: trigger factor [Bacillota bacterium]
MAVDVERIDKHRVKLAVQIPPETVRQAEDEAYRRLVRRVNVPGFRKGKAPRKVLESFVGRGALKEEALDILVSRSYWEAVAESKLEPIAPPRIEDVAYADGEPVRFAATVEVKPEVKLGGYTGLGLTPKPVEVPESAVGTQLEHLRERKARLVPVEDPAATVAEGMVAVIDFTGTRDGAPIEGASAAGYLLDVGSGSFIPGLESGLIGMRVGETREIPVTFPADYHAVELAGNEARFTVTVQELKLKQLPALDDDLAKEAGYQTLEELRAGIENRLAEAARRDVRTDYLNRVIAKIVEGSEVDVPETLLVRRVDSMAEDLAERLERGGTGLERFLSANGKTLDDLRDDLRPRALQAVKADLVLEAVARAEGLEATEADVEAELAGLAKAYTKPIEQVRTTLAESGGLSGVRQRLTQDKVLAFLAAEGGQA